MNRVVGLETEYGCLTGGESGSLPVIARVRRWIFEKRGLGMADLHQREWDEPAGNGGFLFNGGRAYLDMGHFEYCTPECRSLRDLLCHDRVGDRILQEALRELRLDRDAGFIRNNIDHFTGATFGCHENYLVRRAPLTEAAVAGLLAFLTLRVLYTGAGRVGATEGAEFRGDLGAPGADPHFQISQRADYINNDLFEWVQFNRAIINTRDEPLADPRRFRRLHLLHGDTSVLPATLALKVGTTALVLDLLEAGRMPDIALEDAVATVRRLSHRPSGPWRVRLADGREADAVGLLWRFLEAHSEVFGDGDGETRVIREIWGDTLSALESDPDRLIGRVDWVTKRWLFGEFVREEGVSWDDPWLAAQDLEFHHVDPERNLAVGLERTPAPWRVSEEELARAWTEPPADTRARLRSALMRRVVDSGRRYHVDWEMLGVEGVGVLDLGDPFGEDDEPAVVEWLKELRGAG